MKKECDIGDWDFTLKIFKCLENALKSLIKELEEEKRRVNKEEKK